jgi:hypothetical protein
MMVQKRDTSNAIVPHVVVWQCFRCGRVIGETLIWPRSRHPAPTVWSRLARAWHELTDAGHVRGA